MGSLPRERTGVGSATNGAALQLGGALGVGVLGSLLASRYRGVLHPVLAHEVIPKSVLSLINGSLGGALAVAAHVGGAEGAALAAISRRGFVSGMDLAVTAATVVVSVGAVMALGMLPSRAPPATSLGPGSGVSAPAEPAPAGPAPAEPAPAEPAPAEPAPVGTEVRTSEGRLQAP